VTTSTRIASAGQALVAGVRRALDTVGSVVLNVVMGLIQLAEGKPVLPAGSTVTVRTSALTLTLPGGGTRTVEANWYFPNNGVTPTRLIYLQHGFGAVGAMYSYTAAALAEQTNSIVVTPTITSNFLDPDAAWLGGTPMQQAVANLFAGDRQALTKSASAAAGYAVTLPTSFVLVGHSAGATLVMGAAADMVGAAEFADLAGVLLLDGVDLNNTIPAALQKLSGPNYITVEDISSVRYVWNRYGLLGDELQAARPGDVNGVMLVGGRHIDSLQGGNPILQFAEYLVAGFSQPKNVDAVKTLAVGWINDMFAGTHTGVYPASGQSVQISTPRGTATAVGLPFTSTTTDPATWWDGIADLILNVIMRIAVYEPLNGSGAA
jgi:hypothetical protein